MTASTCYVDAPNQRWYDARTGETFPIGEAPALVLGPVYWSQAEMDSWTTGSEFTALTSANGNWTPTVFGSSITTSGEMDSFHEEAIDCLGSAIIWRVNADAGHLADATAYLDNVSDITTISAAVGQDNLETTWAVSNMMRAAYVLDYVNPDFDTFLRNVAWPLCDFTNIANCWAAGAACRLMIASYLQDADLWADAMAYVEYQSRRSIYHSTYDGGSIVPLVGFYMWPNQLGDVTANESATEQHWWNIVSAPSYTASYAGNPFVAGTNAESLRDLGHEAMGLNGWIQAALVMDRCGQELPAEFAARLRAMTEFLAERILHYIQNSTLLAPAGLQTFSTYVTGVGPPNNYEQGWRAAARFYAGDVPADVTALLAESDIISASILGANHQTFDRYADGTLL